MYMEMSGRKRNDKARLVSIKFHALNGGACQMRMFYHMFGQHTKDFNVYLQRDGSDTYRTLFTATGNVGDRWNKAVIDLSKQYDPFRIVIEGMIQSNTFSLPSFFPDSFLPPGLTFSFLCDTF